MPEIYISKDGLATFWFWIGLIAMIAGAVYAERLAAKAGLRSQFIMMTPSNTTLQRLPEKVDHDEEIQRDITELQTRLLLDSVFNKSAIGLDSGDRATRLMTEEAWNWVNENLIESQKDAFREASLHQKLTLKSRSLDIHFSDDLESSDVTFEGSMVRTGVLRRQLFNQEWTVRGTLTWERNTRLRDCGRIPLMCTDFLCRESMKSTITRALTAQEEASLVRAGEDAKKSEQDKKTEDRKNEVKKPEETKTK